MRIIKKIINNRHFWLALVLGLAFGLRIFQLATNPPSLNWDEISQGYNSYSIYNTGGDEWGIQFPLIFRAFGDYKLPLYIYLTAPIVGIFGLNELTVRFISVLSGTGLVYLAYLIGKKVSGNNNQSVGLFAAFLTAVTPWGLFLSRVAVEANLGAFLFAFGIYFLLLLFEKPNLKNAGLTAFFFGLAMFAYNSARVLSPIFMVGVLLYLLFKKKFRGGLLFILICSIFVIPLLLQLKDNSAKARFNLVSIVDEGAVNRINEKRNNTKLPKVLSKLIYNRPLYFLSQAAGNYLKNISPKYLFFRGGSQYQFSLPEHELLYLVTAPFLIIGLILLIFTKKLGFKIILLWLLAGFVPSAITRDAPHVLRSLFVLPAPMIIAALGENWLSEKIKDRSRFEGKLILVVLVFAVSFSFIRWWGDYWKVYPKAYSWSWQYGYKQAVTYIKDNYDSYDQIYISKRYGEPHEFILFYWPWNPKSYQTDLSKKTDFHSDWYWVDSFDKFVFVNDWDVITTINNQQSTNNNETILLITSPGNAPNDFVKLTTINFLDDRPAFEIYENN